MAKRAVVVGGVIRATLSSSLLRSLPPVLDWRP